MQLLFKTIYFFGFFKNDFTSLIGPINFKKNEIYIFNDNEIKTNEAVCFPLIAFRLPLTAAIGLFGCRIVIYNSKIIKSASQNLSHKI